jgi:hypothetical protein
MATPTPKGAEPVPGALRTSRSFSRLEPQQPPDPVSRVQRANTFQNGATAPKVSVVLDKKPDAFENTDAEDPVEPPRASVDLDDMPIELVSMIDKYVCSPRQVARRVTNPSTFAASLIRSVPRCTLRLPTSITCRGASKTSTAPPRSMYRLTLQACQRCRASTARAPP